MTPFWSVPSLFPETTANVDGSGESVLNLFSALEPIVDKMRPDKKSGNQPDRANGLQKGFITSPAIGRSSLADGRKLDCPVKPHREGAGARRASHLPP
jgi:hypothetical protein